MGKLRLPPLDELAAIELELRERAQVPKRPRADFRATLFPGQQEAWDSDARTRSLLWGRRRGKSEWAPRWLGEGCEKHPGSTQLYLAQTHMNCEVIVWPVLQKLDEEMRLGVRFNRAKMRAHFPNGSVILFGSWHDEGVLRKWRGLKPYRAFIDECGEMPPAIFRKLRHDVIGPSLVDYRGQITWAGTPGLAWSGPWFEMTGPADFRIGDVPVFTGDMFDNPYLPHAAEEAALIREENGWDEDHPTYVREYLGRWVRDDEALVFPWDIERNQADELPRDLPKAGWRYVLGVDIGHVDATAYALWGAHENSQHDWLISSSKASGLLVDQVAADVRKHLAQFSPCAVVMDTGGMGKQHAEELRRRFGIPVHAAEKRDKESAIRVFRDRLLAGRAKVISGISNDAWRDEAAVARWNDDRTDIEKEQEDHALHAALYGHRKLRHYLYEPHTKPPEPGTPAAYQAEADELKQAAIKRVQGDGRPIWDR